MIFVNHIFLNSFQGTEDKPLPKLVLKVGKDHKKFKELKGEVSDASHHSENEPGVHHKKKKKKHKHRQDEVKDIYHSCGQKVT